MKIFLKTKQRSAALMLTLWALFLLSGMVISWALEISARLALSGNASRLLEAEALACSGSEIAQHQSVKPGSSVLEASFGQNQSYRVRMSGEGGRINLKWLLQLPERPERVEFLRKYLEIKGVDLNERDQMIDTLLDWVDPDNLVRLNGAEDESNYHPPNRMLLRLDEIKRIRGWEDFTSNDDWDSDFTLDGPPTGIDILWASKEVLMALPGINEQLVDQFISLRNGPDGIQGNEDDPFQTPTDPQALAALGITQAPQIGVLLATAPETVWRVISEGRSGEVKRTVRMVINKQGNPVQLLSWKEY